VTATTLLKKIFHLPRGRSQVEIPDADDHVSQALLPVTSGTRRGEMDRFFDIKLERDDRGLLQGLNPRDDREFDSRAPRRYIGAHGAEAKNVRYRLAGADRDPRRVKRGSRWSTASPDPVLIVVFR